MSPAAAPEPLVRSLQRGLSVIRALSAPEPLSLSDTARATGLSRATARRLLLTLCELGYVTGADGRFALTPRVLDLGYAYLSSLTLPEVAEPHLQQLAAHVGESASVSVLDGEDIVYVARVPARRIMTVAISVGTRFPAYATSMGRVLLAALDDPALSTALERIEPVALTPATITDRAALQRAIVRVRRQGWALVDQELEAGLRSIAAPIRDPGDDVVAAVNLSVPAALATPAAMRRRLLPALLEAAAAIERDLAAGRR